MIVRILTRDGGEVIVHDEVAGAPTKVTQRAPYAHMTAAHKRTGQHIPFWALLGIGFGLGVSSALALDAWRAGRATRTSRTQYRYHYKVGNRIVHRGKTTSLRRREGQHRRCWPGGRIVQIGARVTDATARQWERDGGPQLG